MSLEFDDKDNWLSKKEFFFKPISGLSLALFRICFGFVMFYELGRLIWTPMGNVRYLDRLFHFKYPFFEWVIQAPDVVMHAIFWVGAIAAIAMAIGLFYRISVSLVFICYTYLFLLDISFWNNHYYLYALMCFLMVLGNAHSSLSIDKLRGKAPKSIFRWEVSILQFQLIVVYFYGAVSKLVNPDWMTGKSVETILTNSLARNGLEVSDTAFQFLVYLQTSVGIGFDLIIGLLLLYKRTFPIAVVFSLIFHFANHFFLNIGSFPFAMIGSLFLFVPESWVKQIAGSAENFQAKLSTKGISIFIAVYVSFQLLFPLRHFLYEGLVFWTGEGKLGAWHMMSGSTQIDATYFYLYETDGETGDTLDMSPIKTENFLSPKQQRTLGKWPFLIPQFANYLKVEGELAGMKNLKIGAGVFVSRNNHRFKPIVPDDADLSSLERKCFGHNDWVLLYAEEHY